MTNAVKLRETIQLTYTAILVKAVAEALREHLIVNATLEDEQIKVYEDINVGVAVDLGKGLVVPVIRNADKKSIREIATIVKELVKKTREDKLAREDLTGGTFTITNLGMFGVDSFDPIITPGQSAILAIGRIKHELSLSHTGEVVQIPTIIMTLACDHRIVDGVDGARFLSDSKGIIENPALMFEGL